MAGLVAAGAVVEAMDIGGETPLPAAARNGNTQKLAVLGAAGAAVEPTHNNGRTPLRKAALRCQSAAVAAVVVADPSVETMDNDGMRALPLAAVSGEKEAVAVLMAPGAVVVAAAKHCGTPLHVAACNSNTRTVAALFTADAAVDVTGGDGRTLQTARHRCSGIMIALVAAGSAVEAMGTDGRMPLLLAARGGDEETVAALVAADAAFKATAKDGWAPLHPAPFHGRGGGRPSARPRLRVPHGTVAWRRRRRARRADGGRRPGVAPSRVARPTARRGAALVRDRGGGVQVDREGAPQRVPPLAPPSGMALRGRGRRSGCPPAAPSNDPRRRRQAVAPPGGGCVGGGGCRLQPVASAVGADVLWTRGGSNY